MSMSLCDEHTAFNLPAEFPKKTERLSLIPASRESIEAQRAGNEMLARHLGATVPQGWPPEFISPPDDTGGSGWENCHVVVPAPENHKTIAGLIGVKIWPSQHKTIQIGVALTPEFRGKGFSSEIGVALGKWGLSRPDINRVICDIPDSHQPAAKGLEKAGFEKAADAPRPGFARYELRR